MLLLLLKDVNPAGRPLIAGGGAVFSADLLLASRVAACSTLHVT